MERGKLYTVIDKVTLSQIDSRPVYDPKSRKYYTAEKNLYRYLTPGDVAIYVETSLDTGSVKMIHGDFIGWADSFYLKFFVLAPENELA